MHQHNPRHVHVLPHKNIKKCVTPSADDTWSETSEPLEQEQFNKFRSHVAMCMFLSQDRADVTHKVDELCERMSDPKQQWGTQIFVKTLTGKTITFDMDASYDIDRALSQGLGHRRHPERKSKSEEQHPEGKHFALGNALRAKTCRSSSPCFE